jgi:predicted nucleic acid-binding protein
LSVARLILLDAGVIGLLVSDPHQPAVARAMAWLDGLDPRDEVVVPDVAAFEVRRELLRLRASRKLARLARLLLGARRAEVTDDAWIKAAEFWALVRRAGVPTASPDALDADAILAGVAATIGMPGDEVLIATTNVRHLVRFPGVDARPWESIS